MSSQKQLTMLGLALAQMPRLKRMQKRWRARQAP
jgi:hypothetical protein